MVGYFVEEIRLLDDITRQVFGIGCFASSKTLATSLERCVEHVWLLSLATWGPICILSEYCFVSHLGSKMSSLLHPKCVPT
jgi:hypothetical protein